MGRDHELARTIQHLTAKDQIADHTAQYNHAWDDGLVDAWLATWVEDGSFVLPGAPDTVGRAALRVMIETMIPVGLVHITTNHVVNVMEERATQTCSAILAVRSPTKAMGSSRWMSTGRYRDSLLRTDMGWHFVKRVFKPDAALSDLPKWW
jgi:uncharacterized protein (TIGR02246 family)